MVDAVAVDERIGHRAGHGVQDDAVLMGVQRHVEQPVPARKRNGSNIFRFQVHPAERWDWQFTSPGRSSRTDKTANSKRAATLIEPTLAPCRGPVVLVRQREDLVEALDQAVVERLEVRDGTGVDIDTQRAGVHIRQQ